MKPATKKAIGLGLGMAAVLGLGAWMLHREGLQLAELRETLARFPPLAILVAAAAHAAVVLCSSFRVWLALPRPRAVRPLEVAYVVAAGQAANLFLPARAGDVMKAWMLSRAARPNELSPLAAGGAIVVDKVLDIVCVISMAAAVGFALLPKYVPRGTPQLLWSLAGAAAALLVAAQLVATFRHHPALAKARGWVESFRSGLAGLGKGSVVVLGIVAGVCAWLGEASALRWLSGALGHPLGLDGALIALCALYIGVAVPVSFANLGTFEAALALGLRQASLPLPAALAVAAVHHGGQLLGTGALWLALLAARAIVPRPASAGQEPPAPGK